MHEFLKRHGLDVKLVQIDSYGWYFQKASPQPVDPSWYLEWNKTRSTADAAGNN